MSDSLFYTLPKKLQQSVDDAFNQAVNPNSTTGSLSSQVNPISNTPTTSGRNDGGGGGFILEDNTEIGGGFLVEESDPEPLVSDPNNPEDLIPLDLIPTALQLLDLPPDDDEILAVLRNAASGWSSSSLRTPKPLNPQERYVSRDDWRSVCAVLLETHESEQDHDEDPDDSSQYANARDDEDEDEDAAMSDNYNNSTSSEDGDDDNTDDEYRDEHQTFSRTKRGKAAAQQRRLGLSSTPISQTPKKPTSRQYQTCLDAYALFFPDTHSEELPKRRIMISDIQRVSKLLGEKTKAEEIVEMLEMFSTSKDKAMDFDDFTRMMIAAKLA